MDAVSKNNLFSLKPPTCIIPFELSKYKSFPINTFFIIPAPPAIVKAPPDVELLASYVVFILVPPFTTKAPFKTLVLAVVLVIFISPLCITNGD